MVGCMPKDDVACQTIEAGIEFDREELLDLVPQVQ